MTIESNPHDRFFKATFGRPDLASHFVASFLDESLIRDLDLAHMKREEASFIDEEMAEHFSDLLFRVPLKSGSEESLVYLLFEHKSHSSRLAALQMLRYCVRIWERDRQAGRGKREVSKKLRPIIPILVYNGQRPWSAACEFRDCFAGPESLRALQPAFRFMLLDLAVTREDELVDENHVRACLLAMKSIYHRELNKELPRITIYFAQMRDRKLAWDLRYLILRYMISAGHRLSRKDIMRGEKAAKADDGGKAMPNALEEILEEGRVEGRIEGRREGLLQAIETVLSAKFGPEGLKLMPAIREIDGLDSLEGLLSKIFSAPSIEELRADLL